MKVWLKGSWLILYLLLLNSIEKVQAIPVFARKYNQSCNLCHVSIPKLNAFGHAFRANGYRFPKETPEQVDEQPIKLGGKVQKKLWPKRSIWPGEIPKSPPVAFRLMLDFNVNPEEKVKSDFQFPHEIEILSGGNLGKRVSFFLEFVAYEDGHFEGVERAFLQLNSPIRDSKLFNVKLGQFETAAVPFTRVRRITMEHYLTSSFQNGINPFRFKDWQLGIEVWGIIDGSYGGGLFYGVGMVNGNGTKFGKGTYDTNSAKDIYGRISYKIGGLARSGESGELPKGGTWRDNSFSIGGFAYSGKGLESDFYRLGVDFRWQFQDLDLFGVAMTGNDSFANSLKTDMSFSAYFIEANYVFLPWLLGALRTEFAYTPDDDSVENIQRMVGNLSFSIRPNVVLRLEIVKELLGEKTTTGKMQMDFAF